MRAIYSLMLAGAFALSACASGGAIRTIHKNIEGVDMSYTGGCVSLDNGEPAYREELSRENPKIAETDSCLFYNTKNVGRTSGLCEPRVNPCNFVDCSIEDSERSLAIDSCVGTSEE